MVLNAAVQLLRKAEELKDRIQGSKNELSILQDRNIWTLQQQLQKIYQKILIVDLDYALEKKVEQDLWGVGFKQQIELLQAIVKDRKNARRSEGQAMLSWVLQAAGGFYLSLLHQICTAFKLDLPFRRRASLVGFVEGWSSSENVCLNIMSSKTKLPQPTAVRYICQHCLVHLGDLARYRQQMNVAHTFYRHALLVSAHSGQPYNQLALVSWRRGRKLAALYWHIRSLLVRAPFPPAPANLARTLAAAAAGANQGTPLPVIPGVTDEHIKSEVKTTDCITSNDKFTSNTYIEKLITAYYFITTMESFEEATDLVNTLTTSVISVMASNGFDTPTLIKLCCIGIWGIEHCAEGMDESSLCDTEVTATRLALLLILGQLQSALITCTLSNNTLVLVKLYLDWLRHNTYLLHSETLATKTELWSVLVTRLNQYVEQMKHFNGDKYKSVPLPEDEELNGFLPLERSFEGLKFISYASWETYGGDLPARDSATGCDVDGERDSMSEELIQCIRVYRIIDVAKSIANYCLENKLEYLSLSKVNDVYEFKSLPCEYNIEEVLSNSLKKLNIVNSNKDTSNNHPSTTDNVKPNNNIKTPVVITAAHFKEKVRDKPVGILKPQGSLERSREERANNTLTQDDTIPECDSVNSQSSLSEESKREKKSRINVAMAAILKKQDESAKQVTFATPNTPEPSDKHIDAVKEITPKCILKSLDDLPLDRKLGGILSLKDKSAGYPHLVNIEQTEAKSKQENEERKVQPNKLSQGMQFPPYNVNNVRTASNYQINEPNNPDYKPRTNFTVNQQVPRYSQMLHHFNPYTPQVSNNQSGFRLPVVNPKEIDVRTVTLQKPPEGPPDIKMGTRWHMSNDKKAFLNDLPPRFANQFNRSSNSWRLSAENTNQMADMMYPSTTQNMSFPDPNIDRNWSNTMSETPYSLWKTTTIQPNQTIYPDASLGNQNMFPYQMHNNVNYGSNDMSHMVGSQYMTSNGNNSQGPTLHSLINNTSMSGFENYRQNLQYDSSMYPQFTNNFSYRPVSAGHQYSHHDIQSKDSDVNIDGGNSSRRTVDLMADVLTDGNIMRSLDHMEASNSHNSNSYSLFSGGMEQHQQMPNSLWSGPGPSPLERLLEQQKTL